MILTLRGRVFSPPIRRPMQTFRYSRSLLPRHRFLGPRPLMPRIAQGRASTVGLFVHLKVVCVGIHLVLKDAVGRSTWCIADDEHAPAANIDPDRTGPIPGSLRDRPARLMDGASLTFPAHGAASSD
jgi:hypothetical protein